MLDVLHHYLQLSLELVVIARHRAHFDEQGLYLTMFLEALTDDLLKLFVSVLKQIRIKDLFLDMSVYLQFLSYLLEDILIVAILIRFHFLKQRINTVMIFFKKFGRVLTATLFTAEEIGH